MSFDPRTPYEIHYLRQSDGAEMVECLSNDAEMETRVTQLSTQRIAKAGSISLYFITRRRIGVGR